MDKEEETYIYILVLKCKGCEYYYIYSDGCGQTLENREQNSAKRNLVMDCELLCLNEESIVVLSQTLIGLLLMRQVKAHSFYYSQKKQHLLLSLC